MIFTIDSDGGASGDSDDDAFAMGGAAVRFGGAAAAPAPPPSRKRNATTTPSLATSLDEKLQRRAAKLAVPPAPAGAAGASDETAEVSEAANGLRTLGSVLLSPPAEGRGGRELTLFKSVGVAVQDVATGGAAATRAAEMGIGAKAQL